MRRVLTTLMILLVVLVAGLSALVLLVNPNDFRDYMVRQVESRSGYQLKLDEPLRWHVWPRLPVEHGGAGVTLPELFALLIELGEADSNLVQALRGHMGFVEGLLNSDDPARRSRW